MCYDEFRNKRLNFVTFDIDLERYFSISAQPDILYVTNIDSPCSKFCDGESIPFSQKVTAHSLC